MLLQLIKALVDSGVDESVIRVMPPYVMQVELMKKVVEKFEKVEVNTIDSYQGRDKSVIIYSCAKTGQPNQTSDAKQKLIIIGDAAVLKRYNPFISLLNSHAINQFDLIDGEKYFNLSNILNTIDDQFG